MAAPMLNNVSAKQIIKTLLKLKIAPIRSISNGHSGSDKSTGSSISEDGEDFYGFNGVGVKIVSPQVMGDSEFSKQIEKEMNSRKFGIPLIQFTNFGTVRMDSDNMPTRHGEFEEYERTLLQNNEDDFEIRRPKKDNFDEVTQTPTVRWSRDRNTGIGKGQVNRKRAKIEENDSYSD